MLRKIKTLSVAFAALLMVGAPLAQAVTLGFDPIAQEVPVGDQVMVGVVLSGVTAFDIINSFDVDITFDDALLAFNNVVYPALGLSSEGGLIAPGVYNIGQFGFFAPATTTLAILTFDTLTAGISPLGFNFDPFGFTATGPTGHNLILNLFIPVTPDLGSASITAVPEPGIVLLLGIGLAGVISSRRKMALQA